MSYLWWLIGLENEEKDNIKDRQKHLKYLCCRNIENKNVPVLRSKLNEPRQKIKKTKKK